MSPIQTSEMKEIIEMHPYKAVSDNISPVSVTNHVDNRCLILGTYLRGKKCTTVKIYPKPKAKDPLYHKSYRPITLLPIVSKLFSKIVDDDYSGFLKQSIESTINNLFLEKENLV